MFFSLAFGMKKKVNNAADDTKHMLCGIQLLNSLNWIEYRSSSTRSMQWWIFQQFHNIFITIFAKLSSNWTIYLNAFCVLSSFLAFSDGNEMADLMNSFIKYFSRYVIKCICILVLVHWPFTLLLCCVHFLVEIPMFGESLQFYLVQYKLINEPIPMHSNNEMR